MADKKSRMRFPRKTVYVATAFALLVVVAGFGIAQTLTITQGIAEQGQGVYHGTNQIAWWTETDAGVSVLPTNPFGTLSTTVGTPTPLASTTTSYGINTQVGNDEAQFWKFTEDTTAVVNTELEIAFTVSTGSSPVVATDTVFVQTQTADPGTALTFSLFYDLGSASSGTIVLNSVTEITQQCSVPGTCP